MNWTGKLATIFVRNGKLSFILVIAFFVWGLISFFATPKQYNPRITAPSFEIIIDYPGADRNEVVEVVTRPLENIVTDIAGVEDVFSYSVKGGRAVFTVNFYVGEDPDSAKIMLDDRIRSHMHRIPMGVNDPLIRSIDPDDVPVMTIAVASKDHDPVTLRKFGFKLRDRLSTVEGASNIGVIGGRRKELAIAVNPFKLERIGIGLMDIQDALAVFLIYMVLVAQFRSYTDPLIIMSTIPLSLVGVMPGFMILGYTSGVYFNATSMIGVIALAGIAVNNSIILLEYLNSFKNSCISIEDALLRAGLTRFRPIMLTTVTTMLGSLTIAGDPVWAGLAYALILGLAVSSALTLIVFPALYYVINGKKWDMQMLSEEGVKQDC